MDNTIRIRNWLLIFIVERYLLVTIIEIFYSHITKLLKLLQIATINPVNSVHSVIKC